MSYAGTPCSMCHATATVQVRGRFNNHRPTVDFRCARHAPHPEHVETWTFHGWSDKSFRIDTIEPIA